MDTFELVDADDVTIVYDRYLPGAPPRAVVHIAHGWAEHAGRYRQFAGVLLDEGYAVYADDHRGHGRTGLRAGSLGDLGPGGMDGVVQAVHDVSERARAEHPALPLFLVGHSWGSFIAQVYVRHWGDELAGVVLMGTTDRTVRRERSERPSGRTRYDWLTRDEAEVDKYMSDPWCGFERVGRLTQDAEPPPTRRPLGEAGGAPSGLPVLILNGSDDPVGGEAGGLALKRRYEEEGLTEVTLKVYEGARHELHNETNRDEVFADLVAWLSRVTRTTP